MRGVEREGCPSAPGPTTNAGPRSRPHPARSDVERVARCLIIGCGCRGTELALGLRAAGHSIRATTRDAERAQVLAAHGFDGIVADPDRVATLAAALDHVAVAYILLGSASGSAEAVAALHGT